MNRAVIGLCAISAFVFAGSGYAADGDWIAPGKEDSLQRFSGLDQINTQNVAGLKVAWTFSLGVERGQESAPIVADGTLFLVTPYPHKVYALDLAREGGALKWQYEPKPDSSAQGVACCDTVNRGPTFDNGTIYLTTLDTHVVALDAATGAERWKVKLGNINRGETMTMAPLVVRGKVIVGNSGGEYGVRGWLQALDASSGRSVWKAYATGSDEDVKIGAAFKPFYPQDRGQNLGISTWPPGAWQQGGGASWGFVSYDDAQNLIFYGTGNPGPWNPNQRPGDNKWTNGVFARDADSGEARWFYQWNPHDLFDWDGINENVLIDREFAGSLRKLLVHPDRNGLLYVLDRTTGEVLSADFYTAVNAHEGLDPVTKRPRIKPDKYPHENVVTRDVCPTAPGAKDWSPSAYSPETGFLYVPHNNLCMDWESSTANYIAGTPYVGAELRMKPGPGGHRGEMSAWDITARKEAWTIKENFPVWGGAIATRGGLVFYGNMEGWFKAVDARTGQLLWQFKTGSGIIGQPTTWVAPDGRQYIAIISGVGGWAGSVVSGDLDVRDGTGAKGFVNVTADLKNVTTKGGMLYVFSLP